MLKQLIIAVFLASLAYSNGQLPVLNIDGFAWAENLLFDGQGNLFVAENTRGEIWKINLCLNGNQYCKKLHLSDGIKSVGGMDTPPNGQLIYAGATFDDSSTAIITTSADNAGSFNIFAKTTHQPNGLQCDWSKSVLYYTSEGSLTTSGALWSVSLADGTEKMLKDDLKGADGAWFDLSTSFLFVGLLTDKKIVVLDTTVPPESPDFVVGKYTGLSGLGKTHMLDDLTLFEPNAGANRKSDDANFVLLGADYLGRGLYKFDLNGSTVVSIPPPAGVDSFFQVTSVRWGKGPGFDSNSVYVTEGGGLLASERNRRVLQIRMT